MLKSMDTLSNTHNIKKGKTNSLLIQDIFHADICLEQALTKTIHVIPYCTAATTQKQIKVSSGILWTKAIAVTFKSVASEN